MVRCPCGWPLDSCNPEFAKGKPCGKKRHDAETHRRTVKAGLEIRAGQLESEAEILRAAVALLDQEGENDD